MQARWNRHGIPDYGLEATSKELHLRTTETEQLLANPQSTAADAKQYHELNLMAMRAVMDHLDVGRVHRSKYHEPVRSCVHVSFATFLILVMCTPVRTQMRRASTSGPIDAGWQYNSFLGSTGSSVSPSYQMSRTSLASTASGSFLSEHRGPIRSPTHNRRLGSESKVLLQTPAGVFIR